VSSPAAVAVAKPAKPNPVKPNPVAPAAPSPVAPAAPTPPPAAAVAVPRPAAPEPRKPASVTSYAAAFPVAPDLLVTAAAAVEGADRVMVQPSGGDPMEVEVVTHDAGSGLALLRVPGKRMAYLTLADAFNGGTLQTVSFPSVNIFDPVAEAIPGSAVPPKDEWAVRLGRHPRLAGGPLLAGGKVVGVELATRDADPATVPAATLADLKKLVGDKAGPAGMADPAAATVQVTATRPKKH
jgi:hypothetical protein